ncbi:14439_t:CDS:1, partial [Racocetra persica]
DWINVIDAFVISYNSTVHRAHRHTPHEVMFRWKMHCIYETPDTDQTNEIEMDTDQTNEIEIDTDQANKIEVDTEQTNEIEVDTDNLETNEIEVDTSETNKNVQVNTNNSEEIIQQRILRVSRIQELRFRT